MPTYAWNQGRKPPSQQGDQPAAARDASPDTRPPATAPAGKRTATTLTAADLIYLQRTVGNQAVGRLIRQSTPNPRQEPVVQRRVIEWMPKQYPAKIMQKLASEGDFRQLSQVQNLVNKARYVSTWIDEHTQEAHSHVQGVIDRARSGALPLDQVAAAVDNVGHAADFQNKLAAYLAGTGAMHPSAAGGYVIEDYVSEQIGDDANTQFTPPDLRGSRPDVYFELDPMKEDDYTALIDLTADSKSSVGHVLKKGGGSWINHYRYPFISEVTYPPLQFGDVAPRELSPQELIFVQAQVEAKLREQAEAEAQHKMQYKGLFETTVAEAVRRLNSRDRSWMKVAGRRGTSYLLNAGLAETSPGVWGFADFEGWWSSAREDANQLGALTTVANWLKG